MIEFIHDRYAIEGSTFAVTVTFTDSAGDPATPDSITWTLTNDAGTVVNSREDEPVGTPAASVDIVLSGDDLAMLTGEGTRAFRYLSVDAVYDGSLGDDLPSKEHCSFELWRRDIATAKPVDLIEVKRQLSIWEGNTDHDAYLEHLIAAAHTRVENYCHRKLIQQTVTTYLDGWVADGIAYRKDAIALPYGQLASVTSVVYTDEDGDDTTFSTDDYIVEATQGYGPGEDVGRIVLAYGESWPDATLYPSRPITITHVSGYGSSSAALPDDLRHALLILIADMFQLRESGIVGTVYHNMRTVESLLYPYRMWRFLM